MGLFYPFLDDEVRMYGVEAAGMGLDSHRHAATLMKGRPGVLHGSFSYLLQNEHGQVELPHSISAGLDYPGVGPEHSALKDSRRVSYAAVTDHDAVRAAYLLARLEGIIPALETAHALAYLDTLMPITDRGDVVVVNLSGRGDKDIVTLTEQRPPA